MNSSEREQAMQLFVGLGNPEQKHAGHRHNIGFMLIDRLASDYGFAPFREKYHGLLAEGQIGNQKVLLLKPQTFMNRSGISLAEAAGFFKLTGEQIVVFYDELDLPPGKLRMRDVSNGSMAGHNGLRSIKAHWGTAFRRARLGIGHPGHKTRVTGHVLGDFSKQDALWLAPFLTALSRHAPLLCDGADATYQNRVHEDMRAALPEADKPSSTEETQ
ncbi:MAG: aminoacyl-tRNA hydrolase [Parvibaculales bacterium]